MIPTVTKPRRSETKRARLCLIGLMVPLLFSCAGTLREPREQVEAAQWLSERYQGGAITSMEQADAALSEIEQQRARIEDAFVKERKACFNRFFMNACLDAAAERRRTALSALRKVELEANAFKRHARLAERNRALTERDGAGEKK